MLDSESIIQTSRYQRNWIRKEN